MNSGEVACPSGPILSPRGTFTFVGQLVNRRSHKVAYGFRRADAQSSARFCCVRAKSSKRLIATRRACPGQTLLRHWTYKGLPRGIEAQLLTCKTIA